MPGIHRLQHVQNFRAAALADDDPVRTHAQGIDKKVPDRHLAPAFNVGRTAFQSGPMCFDSNATPPRLQW